MTKAALATPHCVDAGTRMDALFAALQIDSSQWHASSCNDRLCLIPTSARLPVHKATLSAPAGQLVFLSSTSRPFLRPDQRTTLRRAQRRSRLAGGHRRRRRKAALAAASTARASIRSGSATNPDQAHHVRVAAEPAGPANRGVTAPLLFRLPDGRKSHHPEQSSDRAAGILVMAPQPPSRSVQPSWMGDYALDNTIPSR
jgi:hypothetical protein